jgi:hypothetical protein
MRTLAFCPPGSGTVDAGLPGYVNVGRVRQLLEPADLLNLVTVEPIIVPAPLSGFLHVVVVAVATLEYNSVAYVDAGGSAAAQLRYDDVGSYFGVAAANINDLGALLLLGVSSVAIAQGAPQTPLPLTEFSGRAIKLRNVNGGKNDYTLGDSSVVLDVIYARFQTKP